MVKGGVSFVTTVNRLEVTASHPISHSRPLLSLFPRCPIDSWALVMKSTLAGALGEDEALALVVPSVQHG